MAKFYKIKESTLKQIANNIRLKFGLKDEIDPEDFPLYISSDSNRFWITHYNNTSDSMSGTGVVITDPTITITQANNNLYLAFSPTDTPGVYELTNKKNYLYGGTVSGTITVPSGGFVWITNWGSDWSEQGLPNYKSMACTLCAIAAAEWNVGEKFIFEGLDLVEYTVPTSTPQLNWYHTEYICTATWDKIESPTVSIDGYFKDPIWGSGGWYNIDNVSGTYQAAANTSYQLRYKYKMTTDGSYLYLSVASPYPYSTKANIGASDVKLWIRANSSATVYTNIFEASRTGSTITKYIKKNGSLTSNSVINVTDSTLLDEFEVGWIGNDISQSIEFKIPLEQFLDLDSQTEFDYFLSFANPVESKLLTLFNANITIGATDRTENFPMKKWEAASDKTFSIVNDSITSDEAMAMLAEVL